MFWLFFLWLAFEAVVFTIGYVLLLLLGAIFMLVFAGSWLYYELTGGKLPSVRLLAGLSALAFTLFMGYATHDAVVFFTSAFVTSWSVKTFTRPDE